jgi:vacuolar-type H+-ATPase subunit I/STV1
MAPGKGREGMIHEKIQWFKEFYQLDREILPSETGVSYNDLLWLVNTVEQQQQKIERLEEWDAIRRDRIVQLEEQLEQAKEINDRYKNTITETLELLKRGGPGTRSKVQFKLEQVCDELEGDTQ